MLMLQVDSLVLIAGLLLVVFGVIFKVLSKDKERYLAEAQEAGADPARVEEIYAAYRDNKSFVGNITIWLGIGFAVAAGVRLV